MWKAWGWTGLRTGRMKVSPVYVTTGKAGGAGDLPPAGLHKCPSSSLCLLSHLNADNAICPSALYNSCEIKNEVTLKRVPMKVLVAQSCPTLQAHGTQSTRLLCPWETPGRSTEVGCHSLLDLGIEPRSPALKMDSLVCEPPGKPRGNWEMLNIPR